MHGWRRSTAVKPGLAFTIGKWFLTDNSAKVGRILMIFSADPHEILILVKKSALWHVCERLEVGICAQPNFPIIMLIPFDGFHKFRRSRGLNSSGDETTFEAFVESKYASANTLSKRGKYSHRITQCLWKPSLLLWPMIIANAAGSFSTDGLAAASLIFLRKTNWDLCSRQKIASPN